MSLLESAHWELVKGERNQLYGFPEFDPDWILSNLEKFMVGQYPTMTQCMVLGKKA
jgi:hypothetical protein